MIDASDARKEAQKALETASTIELKEVDGFIRDAVRQGKMKITIYKDLTEETRKTLELKGYKVKRDSGDYRDPGYETTISW